MNNTKLDLKGLPDEVIAQLSLNDDKKKTCKDVILNVLEGANGKPMDINSIIVNAYRTEGFILKRRSLTQYFGPLKKEGKIVAYGNGVYGAAK